MAKNISLTHAIQKPSSAPFSLSLDLRQSPSNDGWLRWARNVFRKSKTQSLLPSGTVRSIKPKVIAMSGSKKGCAQLQSV